MFDWLKKSKPTESKASDQQKQKPEQTSPFEILLPEELLREGVPDLKIASRFLGLLAESGLESQQLEVFEKMPLVNSPYPPIKQFITTVNGARQLHNFIGQVEAMMFRGRNPQALGSLCCVVGGRFTEFEIVVRAKNTSVNWQITRRVAAAT